MISISLVLFLNIFAWAWERFASVLSCDSGVFDILPLLLMHGIGLHGWDTVLHWYMFIYSSMDLLITIETSVQSDSNDAPRMT